MLALQRSRRLTSLVRRHSTATHVLQHATLLTERPRMEELVLVRHGESEGNVAYQRSLDGDHSLYSGEFLKRHSSLWRLTDRGREQAVAAGQWLRTQVDCRFDAFFTSEYLRAMETASLLRIPRARWRPEVMFRERDWGDYDLASHHIRNTTFEAQERRRRRGSIFWAPPGGESLAHVIQRVDSMMLFMNRRFANRRVLATCHGELMWAFRFRFERLTQLRYREMAADPQPEDRIHNGQILIYSRRDPASQALHPQFNWVRSVCPWDLARSGEQARRNLPRPRSISRELPLFRLVESRHESRRDLPRAGAVAGAGALRRPA